MEKTKIAILGNNIISNTLSLVLKNNNIDFVNIALPKKNITSRYFAIKPSFHDWFRSVFNQNLAKSYPVNKIQIFFNNELVELNEQHSRPNPLFLLMNSDDIFNTLNKKNKNQPIEIKKSSDIYIDNLDKKISLLNGEIQAELIINTDYRFNQDLCVKESIQSFDEHAIVANFYCTSKISNCAYQFFDGNQILAILPNSESEFSIVLSAKNKMTDYLMDLSDKKFIEHVKKVSSFVNIEMISKRDSYPLIEAKNLSNYQNNILLMGDAAHKIHPLAGQGLNLGLDDVRFFSQYIKKSIYQNFNHKNFINKYLLTRAFDVSFIQNLTKTIDTMMIKNGEFFISKMQNSSILINQTDQLKRIFTKVMI